MSLLGYCFSQSYSGPNRNSIDAFTTLTKDIVDISHKFLDLPRMPPGVLDPNDSIH